MLRTAAECGDFIIEELIEAPGFIDCADIQSPGLSAAPAIGRMTAELALRHCVENEAWESARLESPVKKLCKQYALPSN